MKKFVLMLAFLVSNSLEAFISQFSIFKKKDVLAQIPEYIISIGDVHNTLPQLNEPQSNIIKKIIETSTVKDLFLFEYPFKNFEPTNVTFKLIKAQFDQLAQKFPNTVYLLDYALSKSKQAKTIDFRHYTLIAGLFVQSFQDVINSNVAHTTPMVNVSMKEIGQLILDLLQELQKDYETFKKRESSADHLEKIYVRFYEKCRAAFDKDKEFATQLLSIEKQFIDHLIEEFAKIKNLTVEDFLNKMICNDIALASEFGRWSVENYLKKIIFALFSSVELNSLKQMMNHKDLSKVFIFSGALHANSLDDILVADSYEQVYKYVATSVETVQKLEASGINIMFTELPDLKPVPVEFVSALHEKELTKELFEQIFKTIEAKKDAVAPTGEHIEESTAKPDEPVLN